MAFEWNHEKIETLVNGYRQRTELWDPKDNNYHIKNRKTDAWRQLASDVGCGVPEAKTKMTSLLSSYRRERAKEKKTMITGSGRGQLYVSTWFAYKLFTFLREKDTPLNTMDTESLSIEPPEQVLEAEDEGEPLELEHDLQSCSNTTATRPSTSQKADFVAPRPQKRKQKQGIEERRLAQAFRILDNVDKTTEDECSTFGQHVAAKLRKFDDRYRNFLMHKISTVIFDAEIEIDSQQRMSTASSPASGTSIQTPTFSPQLGLAYNENLQTQEMASQMETGNQPSVLQELTTTADTLQTYLHTFK